MNWQDLLGELVALVKTTAPEVWTIARRQVTAEAVEMGIWALWLLILAGASLWFARYGRLRASRNRDEWGYSEWDLAYTSAYILSTGLSLIVLGLFVGLVKRFINPDYYTIEILLSLIK